MNLRPKRRYRQGEVFPEPVPVSIPVPITGERVPHYRLKRSGQWRMVPRRPRAPLPTPKEQFATAVTNAFARMQHFLPLRHSH